MAADILHAAAVAVWLGGLVQIAFVVPRLAKRLDDGARTREPSMVAAAHFMHHRYESFNAPLTVLPPL